MNMGTNSPLSTILKKWAWLYAASWGSAMTSGDPGAVMYTFNENFTVNDENHRNEALEYVDKQIEIVKKDPRDFDPDELTKLKRLKSCLRRANITGQVTPPTRKLPGFVFQQMGDNGLDVKLTKACIESCAHGGSCDADCREWATALTKNLAHLSDDFIKSLVTHYLFESFADNPEDFESREDNLMRLIWIAAGDADQEGSTWVYLTTDS